MAAVDMRLKMCNIHIKMQCQLFSFVFSLCVCCTVDEKEHKDS